MEDYLKFRDEIDEFLFKEFGISGGCCSSIESLKYTIAREVAEKLWKKKKKIEFVSYDGKYPSLCIGTLVIKVDGETQCLKNVLVSGGSVVRNGKEGYTSLKGEWSLDLSKYPELKEYEKEITDLVNENVNPGCCGGCC